MTYELINTATTNTLASFNEEHEAYAACVDFARQHHLADDLVVVAFDDDGEAVASRSALELGAYA